MIFAVVETGPDTIDFMIVSRVSDGVANGTHAFTLAPVSAPLSSVVHCGTVGDYPVAVCQFAPAWLAGAAASRSTRSLALAANPARRAEEDDDEDVDEEDPEAVAKALPKAASMPRNKHLPRHLWYMSSADPSWDVQGYKNRVNESEYFRAANQSASKKVWENRTDAPPTGYMLGHGQMMRHRLLIHSNPENLYWCMVFALMTANEGTAVAEKNLASFAPLLKKHGTKLSKRDFLVGWRGGQPENKWKGFESISRTWDRLKVVLAENPKLDDRDLRRKIAAERAFPDGLGQIKFTFALECMGQDVACLDRWMWRALGAAHKTERKPYPGTNGYIPDFTGAKRGPADYLEKANARIAAHKSGPPVPPPPWQPFSLGAYVMERWGVQTVGQKTALGGVTLPKMHEYEWWEDRLKKTAYYAVLPADTPNRLARAQWTMWESILRQHRSAPIFIAYATHGALFAMLGTPEERARSKKAFGASRKAYEATHPTWKVKVDFASHATKERKALGKSAAKAMRPEGPLYAGHDVISTEAPSAADLGRQFALNPRGRGWRKDREGYHHLVLDGHELLVWPTSLGFHYYVDGQPIGRTKTLRSAQHAAGMAAEGMAHGMNPAPAGCLDVGRAYLAAPDASRSPEARALYAQYARETAVLWDLLRMKVNFTHDDPYKTSAEMRDDVLRTRTMRVFSGGADHPLLTPEQNLKGRAVHDLLAHLVCGCPFTATGEFNAFEAQAALYSTELRPLLFTEIVGQTCAYLAQGERHAEQKVVFLGPEYEKKAEGMRRRFEKGLGLAGVVEAGLIDPRVFDVAHRTGYALRYQYAILEQQAAARNPAGDAGDEAALWRRWIGRPTDNPRQRSTTYPMDPRWVREYWSLPVHTERAESHRSALVHQAWQSGLSAKKAVELIDKLAGPGHRMHAHSVGAELMRAGAAPERDKAEKARLSAARQLAAREAKEKMALDRADLVRRRAASKATRLSPEDLRVGEVVPEHERTGLTSGAEARARGLELNPHGRLFQAALAAKQGGRASPQARALASKVPLATLRLLARRP